MIDLIDAVKPYEIYDINTIPKSLAFYKNILKIISKKGCIEFSYNNIYPIRWSIKKQRFVIDFRTKKPRDVDGLCCDTLSQYYSIESNDYSNMLSLINSINKKKSEDLWDDIKIKKNENRFLCFTKSNNENFIFLGLYIFNQTKGREGKFCSKGKKSVLIDNSEKTINNICKLLNSSNIIPPVRYKINFYLSEYNCFKSELFNFKVKHIKENEEIIISLYDHMNTMFKKDYSFSLCKDLVLNSKINNKEKDVENILPFIIHNIFLDFIKKVLLVNSGIMVYDSYLQKNIVIKEFNQTNYIEKKNPIEYDNTFMLPGVF
jgi:hypothetical protein